MSAVVRTVLGDVPAAEIGVCYAHEHVIIHHSFTTQLYPEFLLDDVDRAAAELREVYAAGGRTMIDSMPCGAGRNVLKLAEVSRRSGVRIVCPTGLHLAKYYPPGHWAFRLDEKSLAKLFIADIAEGIDANDYNGPDVQRTEHRAGIIKIASGLDRIDDHEAKVFAAAGAAHAETGAPILTHTEAGTAALQQVELLGKHGVPARHVVLSHTDRKPDVAYHAEVLSTGAFVEYDSAFRWKSGQGNPTRDLIVAMCQRGLGGQVMLGMDAARRSYWKSHGGAPGMTYLITTFRRELAEVGVTAEQLEAIFVANPARAFAFAT